jgi:predicted RNA-binding Zn ribbon-like protein
MVKNKSMTKKRISTLKPPQLLRKRKALIPPELIAQQVGGHLALDFCNTAGEHLSERPNELWRDWEAFLRWAMQAGLIGPESYFELLPFPEPLSEIIQLREVVYRVGVAVASGRPISERDGRFIRERANAARPEVEFRNDGMHWRPAPLHVSRQLGAVLAGEALSLFCSSKATRVGICEGGKCGWLFLDESRGKRRRWCDMNDCGSRAKARRYYERHKEA